MNDPTSPFDAPRRAVEQATDVFVRLLQAFDPRPSGDPLDHAAPAPAEGDAAVAQLRSAVGRAVDLYVDLFQRTFDVYVESIERTLRRRGTSVSGQSGSDVLALGANGDERVATGQLHLHNFSGHPIGPVRVLLTDLTACDGSTIEACRAELDPARLERVEDRTSVPIAVNLDVSSVAPGTYFGHVMVGDGALAVRVEVP